MPFFVRGIAEQLKIVSGLRFNRLQLFKKFRTICGTAKPPSQMKFNAGI